ncbi:unnamed protein product [Vitrella brassicaformis CCMP3155]|uniref:Uncharacterized protein n=1 Tax=Vitrella brassicaformis (strain CCMP3155) TaxID=1169540 RepID=A0A0G4ESL8_VITBC|nr:unnamed protein product [Vitrella brassicaformis CCMP3155]|mmetsp:Transcript_7442/g.21389  ORF Transcript_7442/g.21389 Transcript_7442/m.21389 type:complete len:125 (-) Transcript_7442:281-655(-)|eukprot:CEM00997.1 unnamed protein product [Vitrella brassicaformis CCMP3155]
MWQNGRKQSFGKISQGNFWAPKQRPGLRFRGKNEYSWSRMDFKNTLGNTYTAVIVGYCLLWGYFLKTVFWNKDNQVDRVIDQYEYIKKVKAKRLEEEYKELATAWEATKITSEFKEVDRLARFY